MKHASFFFLNLIFVFILFVRKREIPSIGSHPLNALLKPGPGPGWSQEPRLVFPMGVRDPSTWALIYCLPAFDFSRKLYMKQRSWDLTQSLSRGVQTSQLLNPAPTPSFISISKTDRHRKPHGHQLWVLFLVCNSKSKCDITPTTDKHHTHIVDSKQATGSRWLSRRCPGTSLEGCKYKQDIHRRSARQRQTSPLPTKRGGGKSYSKWYFQRQRRMVTAFG